MRRMMGKAPMKRHVATRGYVTNVATIRREHGIEGILCVTEVAEAKMEEAVRKYGSGCDLFCLLYSVSSPLSILAMEKIVEILPEGCKVMLVETKHDLRRQVSVGYRFHVAPRGGGPRETHARLRGSTRTRGAAGDLMRRQGPPLPRPLRLCRLPVGTEGN